MEHYIFAAYCLLAVLALIQAFLGGLQTWEHRRFARNRFKDLPDCRPRGKAMIFAPCKGVDLDLKKNLQRLFQQDYEEYEITFIVQTSSDPACALIEDLMAENRHIRSHLVIAGKADAPGDGKISGQKVHNLRVATENLSPEIDFLVFVDSDSQPRKEWLRALVGRLGKRQRHNMGAATGYRWMVPERATPANCLLYSINCGITTLLGTKSNYPVWGGSWAIRRETFEAIDLHDRWAGTLSDDLVATQVLAEQNRPVKYEPACLVTSPIDGNFRETFSFLRRQYLIARFYTPGWWFLALVTMTVVSLIWPASIAMLCVAIWAGTTAYGDLLFWLPVSVLASFYGLGVYRGWLRQSLVKLYFPHMHKQLRGARLFDILAGPMASWTHWAALVAASLGRTITWRNITYRLYEDGRVETVSQYPLELKAFGNTADGELAGGTYYTKLNATENEQSTGTQRAA
ncbi:MAG: glycosyltransferase family 2 protein [Pirellulales bacterium]|nr:glycosyltransferase family 2 protein [Pirellulales bacterium]